MKRKLAILMVGAMIGSAMLTGCGQDGNTESKQTAAETGELKGDITFWHSFTQGPRLEVIQETADQFMKDNPDVNIRRFPGGIFIRNGPPVLHPGMCRI